MSGSELLEPRSRVGRYRVGGVLGEGASGVVYDAVCEEAGAGLEPGAHVALKVVHRRLLRDAQVLARFRREARILMALRAPELVSIHETGEAPSGAPFMALERVEGLPLDALARRERLAPERAARLVIDVCRGLARVHAAGVVHRDLKPGNVMVERPGEGERARLLDFGLSKLLSGDANDSWVAVTEQHMVFGTPEYMAPEQARGDELDGRADLYAAGVILYELVCGQVPFRGASPVATMTAHLSAELPLVRSRAPDVSPALAAVIEHALARDRDARYSSPEALATAVERALREPEAVVGVAPPSCDPALVDTELALTAPSRGARPTPPSAATPSKPNPADEPEAGSGPGRVWLVVAIVAALVGVAIGVVMSLITAL